MTTWDFLSTELATLEREGLLVHARTTPPDVHCGYRGVAISFLFPAPIGQKACGVCREDTQFLNIIIADTRVVAPTVNVDNYVILFVLPLLLSQVINERAELIDLNDLAIMAEFCWVSSLCKFNERQMVT